MRYREFNLTEDELFELKMSPSNLARMAKDIDARAGLEFEMYVPNVNADDEEEFESEPDYGADESFPTGSGWQRDVMEFFRGGDMSSPRVLIQRALDDLNENFYEHVGEQEHAYVNSDAGHERALEIAADNVSEDDFDSTEEYEAALQEYIADNADDISDQLADEFRGDLDSLFEKWLDDNDIGMMSDFASEYGLEWPYWTQEPDDYSRGGADINDVARDFGDAIGRKVKVGSYHSGAYSQTDNYRVETDSSLDEPEEPGDAGLEFISPALTIPEMLEDIKKVAEWANRVGAYTNSSTGLHMNVSVPGYSMQQLDYVKLAVFLGDNYILEQFGREGNRFCQSALTKIKAEVKQDPARLESMLKSMQGELNSIASKIVHTGNTSKYTSINTQSNRVEFRGPGNDWLGELADGKNLIQNTLLRTVVALDIAMKPEAFRQEYMKKLYKVLTPTEFAGARGERQERVVRDTQDVVSLFAKYAAGELPKAALKSFVKQLRLERGKKLPPGSEPQSTASRDQEFSGTWEIVARNTDEVVRGFGGVGNGIRDAEAWARRWAMATGYDDPYYVRPVMRPRTRPPEVSTYQIVNNNDGEILYPGRSMHWNYARAVADEIARRNSMGRADIRIVDLENNQTYSFEGRLIQPSVRATTGEPVPAGAVGGEQSSDANYEIIDLETMNPVFRLIANTDEEAQRKLRDWVVNGEHFYGRYHVRRIAGRGIPGSTAELARQRAGQQEYMVAYTYTRDGEMRNNQTEIRAANANAAMDTVRFHLEQSGYEVLRIEAEPVAQTLEPPPETVDITMPGSDTGEIHRYRVDYQYRQRADQPYMQDFTFIDATEQRTAEQELRRRLVNNGISDFINVQARMAQTVAGQGTESLPPGNTRWLVLDQNDREVYSFVHRSDQREANLYAANWLRDQGLLGSGEFMVVPAR